MRVRDDFLIGPPLYVLGRARPERMDWMRYVEGFVAVPAANKELYQAHIAEAARLFKTHGALRVVEC